MKILIVGLICFFVCWPCTVLGQLLAVAQVGQVIEWNGFPVLIMKDESEHVSELSDDKPLKP